MAMILTLDRVQGTSYDSNLQQTIIYRGFVATQLPNNVPADVIRQAIVGPGGLPAINTPHPTQTGSFVIGYSIRLIGDTQAEGFVKYSSSTFVNKFQFSRHSYLQSVQTEIDPVYPGTMGGEPIHVIVNGGTGNSEPIYDNEGYPIAYKQGTSPPGHVSYLRPMGVFRATGVFTTPPNITAQGCFGQVNQSTFLGLPIGYWLCNDVTFSSEDLGTTFFVSIQFITLQNEDWSSYLIGTDQLGRPVAINPSVMTALRAAPYSLTPAYKSNVSKYGLYTLGNFSTAFGFQNQQAYLNQFTFPS
jgi:hypothetical protein